MILWPEVIKLLWLIWQLVWHVITVALSLAALFNMLVWTLGNPWFPLEGSSLIFFVLAISRAVSYLTADEGTIAQQRSWHGMLLSLYVAVGMALLASAARLDYIPFGP